MHEVRIITANWEKLLVSGESAKNLKLVFFSEITVEVFSFI